MCHMKEMVFRHHPTKYNGHLEWNSRREKCKLSQHLYVTSPLELVTSGGSSTSGAFELAASLSSSNIRSGVLAVETTEVLGGFTSMTLSLDQNGLGTSGSLEGQLVESNNVTASLNNARAGSISNVEGAHVHGARESEQTFVISDGTNNDGDVVGLSVLLDLGEGHSRSVHARHHQAAQYNSVEARISSTSQELVELSHINTIGLYCYRLP